MILSRAQASSNTHRINFQKRPMTSSDSLKPKVSMPMPRASSDAFSRCRCREAYVTSKSRRFYLFFFRFSVAFPLNTPKMDMELLHLKGMSRFSPQIKSIVKEVFAGLDGDVALIGSNSYKDLDLFVVNKVKDFCSGTKLFLELIPSLQRKLECDFIVKNEHHNFLKSDKRIVHLLYYPSYEHLQIWELPFFVLCVRKTGEFCVGDNAEIAKIDSFRWKSTPFDCNILKYHLYSYTDIAISSLIYLASNSTLFSYKAYLNNLIYVYRYSLREHLISEKMTSEDWEFNDLFAFAENKPELAVLLNILKLKDTCEKQLSRDDFKLLFLEYLKFTTIDLSEIYRLDIERVLSRRQA